MTTTRTSPPALAVSCPVCRVQPGQPCRDPLGAITERHPNRHFAWDRAGRPHLSVPGAMVGFPDRKVPPMPTTTTNPRPDVPLPAGAEKVYDWENPGTPGAYRYFRGRVRTIPAEDTTNRPWSEDITVHVQGTQRPDGTIDEHDINVHQLHSDNPITAKQARQLAAALLEAAAELDRWAK